MHEVSHNVNSNPNLVLKNEGEANDVCWHEEDIDVTITGSLFLVLSSRLNILIQNKVIRIVIWMLLKLLFYCWAGDD